MIAILARRAECSGKFALQPLEGFIRGTTQRSTQPLDQAARRVLLHLEKIRHELASKAVSIGD